MTPEQIDLAKWVVQNISPYSPSTADVQTALLEQAYKIIAGALHGQD